MSTDAAGAAGAEPQAVLSPLTGAAIFLVVVVNQGQDSADTVRGLCGDLAGLIRAVGFRGTEDYLTCVAGHQRGRVGPADRPAEARRAAPVHGDPVRLAVRRRPPRATCCSTSVPRAWTCASSWPPRSWRGCRDAVTVADEVHGFRYFEHRDLLGFVDGTENPAGQAGVRTR